MDSTAGLVGQRPQHAAQLAHRGGRRQVVPRDVADTHREVAVGQVEGVVPVAADLEIRRRGHVPGLHLQPRVRRRGAEHRRLQGHRHLPGLLEVLGVLDRDGRPRRQLHDQRPVVLGERRAPPARDEQQRRDHDTPRDDRRDEHRGDPDLLGPAVLFGRPVPGLLGRYRHRDEHGVAGAHAAGDGVGGAEGEPLVVRRRRKHAVGRPRDRAAAGDGTAAGLPGVDQVHPAEVGELRDHRLGQRGEPFLRVVHRAHGARRPGEHGEPLAGPDLVVDVGVGAHPLDDDARDAHRHRPRAEPAVPAFRAQR